MRGHSFIIKAAAKDSDTVVQRIQIIYNGESELQSSGADWRSSADRYTIDEAAHTWTFRDDPSEASVVLRDGISMAAQHELDSDITRWELQERLNSVHSVRVGTMYGSMGLIAQTIIGRRECFCSEEGRGKRTDCTSGYA